MSESSLTAHTAPRTVEGLAKESPFKLRLLVQALGGLTTEADKMAWHDMKTPEARAGHVLTLLQRWDAANPGAAAPSNGATVPAQTMTQQVAPVAPAAVDAAAVAAAAAATGDKPKRAPRTSASQEGPPADLAVDVVALLNRTHDAVEKGNKAAGTDVEAILRRMAALEDQLKAMQKLQTWALMAFLTSAQETLKVSMVDILSAAISDSADFEMLVKQALGKA